MAIFFWASGAIDPNASAAAGARARMKIFSHRGWRTLHVSKSGRRRTTGSYPNHTTIFEGRHAVGLYYGEPTHRFGFFEKQRGTANPSRCVYFDKFAHKITFLVFQSPSDTADGECLPHRLADAIKNKVNELLGMGIDFGHLVVIDASHQIDEYYDANTKRWRGKSYRRDELPATLVKWTAREICAITKDFGASKAFLIPIGADATGNIEAILNAIAGETASATFQSAAASAEAGFVRRALG